LGEEARLGEKREKGRKKTKVLIDDEMRTLHNVRYET
jgi:hypothetical protein